MSDDKVVTLNIPTRLDIPVERVHDAARDVNLQSIVIIGYDEDGDFYFASSYADGGDVLWLMEMAKKRLLEIGEGE